MPDAAAFRQAFADALAGRTSVADPALARALAVHRNTATQAAREALADNFPVTAALVGDDAFAAAAGEFVGAHPPADPRLCLYGADFPEFLRDFRPFAELAYLADVAMVERMVVEALFAADAVALDGSELGQGINLDRPLMLHPATRFAALPSPAGSIWLAHQPGADPALLGAIDWHGEAVLVTRPADALIVTVVNDDSIPFLAACAHGRPLGEAAAAAVDATQLSSLFATLIAAGAFASRPHDRNAR